MPNTDFSSMRKHHNHNLISLRKSLRCGFAVVLCSCLFYGAAQCRAQESQSQDVAEAARQERARKEADRPRHVYTDEDLRRLKILTPEDEARVAAIRKLQPAPGVTAGEPGLDAAVDLQQLPLGDVARLYRRAKQATESPFHLAVDQPTFASPILPSSPVEPKADLSAPVPPKIMPRAATKVAAPKMHESAPVRRRDPFARKFVPMTPTAPVASTPAEAPSPMPQADLSRKFASTPLLQPHVSAKTSPAPAPQPNPSRKFARSTIAPSMSMPAPVAPKAAPPSVNPSVHAPTTAAELRVVTVQPGDSLWKIAAENLGRGSRWREVLAANPSIMNPTELKAGTQLNLPFDARSPHSEKVKVNAGDTLTKIAQAQYGRANYWRCIAEANPTVKDVNRIFEGEELNLPSRCKP